MAMGLSSYLARKLLNTKDDIVNVKICLQWFVYQKLQSLFNINEGSVVHIGLLYSGIS